MKNWIRRTFIDTSLAQRIRAMMIVIVAAVGALVLFMMVMLLSFTSQYNTIIFNFTTASQFSDEFRYNMDEKMYWYVAGRWTFEEADPISELEEARAIVNELAENTASQDSLAQLYMIQRNFDALENGINEVHEGPPEVYDEDGNLLQVSKHDRRQSKLDLKVYRLTGFIEESMLQYVFFEAKHLADVHARLTTTVQVSVVSVGVLVVLILALLFVFAMRTANSITRPMRELNENIRLVGEGDFTVRPVQSSNNELQTMSDTLDGMVERIVVLMDNIRLEQENLRRTELELLQSQINPHFLYNAFDTVIWLAEDNQTEKVVGIVESLSNFFRTSLSKGRNFITVGEEMLHVRSYLEIQQTRYSDILEYDIACPEALDGFIVQKLTLQPLVENALYHGVKNKRGLGKITVNAHKEGSTLVFEVWDNGMGIEPEKLETLRESLQGTHKSGYGMANVQERIQLYYGKEFGLTLESEYGSHTKVSVRIPAQKTQPKS